MITYPINIKIDESGKTFITEKREEFSYAFRKGYKFYSNNSVELEKYLKSKFNLTDIESRSVVSKVKAQFDANSLNKKDKEERILDITEQIEKLKSEKKKKYKIRERFKLIKKLKKLDKFLSHDIVFGTKTALRKISFLSNFKDDRLDELNKFLIEYQERRMQEIYLIGEANQKGNRYFDFDFKNKEIIYKPCFGIKIYIKLNIKTQSKYYKNLLKLEKLINNKEISVTVGLTEKKISITFNEEILSGYSLNTKERTKEVRKIKEKYLTKEHKDIKIKEIYKQYYESQNTKMSNNKLPNRILAFDSNPNFIGYSVIDKLENNEVKVIHTGFYNLTKLNKKLPKDITIEERKHINNKRKHEINHIWKDIFEIAFHFKVSKFGKEDLEFKSKEAKEFNKEFNRQTKNLWHRNQSDNLINKYCKTLGIKLIECNPVYTSFIGNLKYEYFDPTNSSIEIGRRCLYKYNKNSFYPTFCTETILHTMSKFNEIKPRDVEAIKGSENWKVLYKNIKESGLRYRAALKDVNYVYNKCNNLRHRTVKKIVFV